MKRYVLGFLFFILICSCAMGQIKEQYIYLWDTSLFLEENSSSYETERDMSKHLISRVEASLSSTEIIVVPFQMYELDSIEKKFVDKEFGRLSWMIRRLKKKNVNITGIDISKNITSVSSLVNSEIPSYIYILTDGRHNIYKRLSISKLLTTWDKRAVKKNAYLFYYSRNVDDVPVDFKKIDKNLPNFSIISNLTASKFESPTVVSNRKIRDSTSKHVLVNFANKPDRVAYDDSILLGFSTYIKEGLVLNIEVTNGRKPYVLSVRVKDSHILIPSSTLCKITKGDELLAFSIKKRYFNKGIEYNINDQFSVFYEANESEKYTLEYFFNMPELVSYIEWWYFLILFVFILLLWFMIRMCRYFFGKRSRKSYIKNFMHGDFTSHPEYRNNQLEYLFARGIQKKGKSRGKANTKEFPLSVTYGETNGGIVDVFMNDTLIGIKDVMKNEFIVDRQRSMVDGVSVFLGHPRYEKNSSYKVNDRSNFHSFETNDLGRRIKFYSKLTSEYFKEIKDKTIQSSISEEERKCLVYYDADIRFSVTKNNNLHSQDVFDQYNDSPEYIIPLSCGGIPEVINQYPQAFVIVKSKRILVEELILEHLDKGEDVELRGEITYSNYTFRPSEIIYSINVVGEKPITFKAFVNKNINISDEHINLYNSLK
ncbi:MAG: hypothetical protein WBG43_09745 [Marinifilaceae bacterium]